MVEHDMDAVFALADRLTVMADGQPIAEILPGFLDYVDGSVVVGHNIARFDNRFVDRVSGELYNGKGFNFVHLNQLAMEHLMGARG